MVDVVANDVSAVILSRRALYTGQLPGQIPQLVMVVAGITIDPGTTDTYPTTGIPLDNLFQAAGGVSDTWLDVTQQIIGIPSVLHESATAFTRQMPVFFLKTGTAANTAKLVLGASNGAAAGLAALQNLGNTDLTDATVFNGDTDPYCEMAFIGFLRPGKTLANV